MISTPILGFGAPVYYGYYNTGAYTNDNGNAVRKFFAQDSGRYIQNSFLALFGFPVQNYAYNYYGPGRGSSSSNARPSNPNTETKVETITRNREETKNVDKPKIKETTSSKPAATNPVKTNPVKTAPKASNTEQQSFTQRDLGKTFVQTARKYSSCTEEDGTHHKFCINPTCKEEDPYDQEWCTDFVTYVVKESYKKLGKAQPYGFGDHDVETLKNWAIENNMFIKTANKFQKATFIAQNIKPGDIFIMNEDGASHTGFVTKVDKTNGVIYTIEGNRDDMVKEYSYSPDNPELSGFIRLKP